MGRPKAWLPFGEELMLQRLVRIVGEIVNPVLVVAAREQELPELPPGASVVRDEHEDRGPLQGLASGMRAMNEEATGVFLSSCDVPFLNGLFIQRMISFIENETAEKAVCAVPYIAGQLHPLAAAYRLSALPLIEQLLAAGARRLTDLCELLPARFIESHELADVDPAGESLWNLNAPDEYAAALRVLQSRRSE